MSKKLAKKKSRANRSVNLVDVDDLVEEEFPVPSGIKPKKKKDDLVEEAIPAPSGTKQKRKKDLVEKAFPIPSRTKPKKKNDLVEEAIPVPSGIKQKKKKDLVEEAFPIPSGTKPKKKKDDLVEEAIPVPSGTKQKKKKDLVKEAFPIPSGTKAKKKKDDLVEEAIPVPTGTKPKRKKDDLVEQRFPDDFVEVVGPYGPIPKKENLDLVVKRIGGGSIIDHCPLFSNEGDTLYVLRKKVIRAYSTLTGDCVKKFEAVDDRISWMLQHPDKNNVIIGCTENGKLISWICPSGIIINSLELKLETKNKIKTFHIVKYKFQGHKVCQALITYLLLQDDLQDLNKIHVALFDIENDGTCTKSTFISTKSPEYYIDVIGNYGKNLIALLHDADLHILNPARNLVDKLHKIGDTGRIPTCIAGHPEEECVATGDSTGRIVVWRNLFLTRPYTVVFHWHTLPAAGIVFSKSGGHMYTGGRECVLVKWTLANPKRKTFIPRLPAPIKHLAIAPDNSYVAVSTIDNGISIVNYQNRLTTVIQHFAWSLPSSSILSTWLDDPVPTGLIFDPRTGCLVLSSRTGHVQFYDIHKKNLLYNIHITDINYYTEVRDENPINVEVTKVALSYNGIWMATIEEWHRRIPYPGSTYNEVRLKVWKYDLTQQKFVLNSWFEYPHENGVKALKFQPDTSMYDDEEWFLVTTGKDNKFKLWYIEDTEREVNQWKCYGKADYRKLPVSDASFAMDGSYVGVGFSNELTLWIPETFELKGSLSCTSLHPEPITHIEFGQAEACYLVVAASREYMICWNLVNFDRVWRASLSLVGLVSDPKSMYMAAFTSDNLLVVFSPTHNELVYKKESLVEDTNSILAAAFVPHLEAQEKPDSSLGQWQQKSQLFLLDSNRELLTLESKPKTPMDRFLETMSDEAVPLTNFSNLKAVHTSSGTEQTVAQIHEHPGASSSMHKRFMNALFCTPSHALPPLRTLYMPFMKSLMAEQSSKNAVGSTEKASDDEDNRDDALDSSDDEVSRPTKSEATPANAENEDSDESTVKVKNIDWSFLRNILPN